MPHSPRTLTETEAGRAQQPRLSAGGGHRQAQRQETRRFGTKVCEPGTQISGFITQFAGEQDLIKTKNLLPNSLQTKYQPVLTTVARGDPPADEEGRVGFRLPWYFGHVSRCSKMVNLKSQLRNVVEFLPLP